MRTAKCCYNCKYMREPLMEYSMYCIKNKKARAVNADNVCAQHAWGTLEEQNDIHRINQSNRE